MPPQGLLRLPQGSIPLLPIFTSATNNMYGYDCTGTCSEVVATIAVMSVIIILGILLFVLLFGAILYACKTHDDRRNNYLINTYECNKNYGNAL